MRSLPPAPPVLAVATTDAHTHLASTASATGLMPEDLIAAAAAVGVTRMVDVGTDVESSVGAVDLASQWPQVIACVAIHPNDAARLGSSLEAELGLLAPLADAPGVRAVGETGLDYFRTTDADGMRRQRASFAAHIALAKSRDLALVIHDRDAHEDVLAVLDSEGAPSRVMMHCFSGDVDFARRCLERGFWLSFPGTVTFKPNHALRAAMLLTPVDRLLVETDAPYLTPVPYRGRPNASYLLPHTVGFMAGERREDIEELSQRLADNATAVFGQWGS